MAITMLSDLFNPQVVGNKLATEYGNEIVVSRFAEVSTDLTARPGDTITRNQYNYIGDAVVLGEAEDDTPVKLTTKQITKTVVKVSRQVQLTDEDLLSAADDPYGEAIEQIARSIAIKDDKDAIAELLTATQTATGGSLAVATLNGLKVFGETGLKNNVIEFANTSDYLDMVADHDNWIPASEIAAALVQRGVVGKYMGANIVPTDTVDAGSPILMLEGALAKEMKRNFLAEQDRDLSNYTWLLAGTEHRVYWVKNLAKVVKLSVS